ncbi:hypothetical protein K501DRAFT_166463 [Backusella circina FSU 941]|nr:hypothetical protein K501DRAFT_166463 [Backusella circina FSU 941]
MITPELRPAHLTHLTQYGRRIQWVYANGSEWIPLDPRAQYHIEQLWNTNSSYWIQSDSRNFNGPIYVDISNMCLLFNRNAYSIARQLH